MPAARFAAPAAVSAPPLAGWGVPAVSPGGGPAWARGLPEAGPRPTGDLLTAALTTRYPRVAGDVPHAPTDPLADPRRPAVVLAPEGYEPGYAYPLVVWLHDAGDTERDLPAVVEAVSDRNHLALAVRGVPCGRVGSERRGPRFGWSDKAVGDLADRLPGLVAAVRADWHVNPDRVFLAGVGAGADAAAALLAARPGYFAGAALLAGGTLPPPPTPDGRPDLAGRRVLLSGGPGRADAPKVLAAAAGWRALGAAAELHLDESGPLAPKALRAVDAFLLKGVGVGV